MSKEINYPVKYAVLGLMERGGWSTNFENLLQGYIASKCYVVESNVVYHSDGTNEVTHKVVFPFNDIECFKRTLSYNNPRLGDERIPSYDACDRPYPTNTVSKLFDTYEDAKAYAEEKNEEHRHELMIRASLTGSNWEKQYAELLQTYDKNLKLCNLYEQMALEQTANIELSEEQEEKEPQTIKILIPVKNTKNNS